MRVLALAFAMVLASPLGAYEFICETVPVAETGLVKGDWTLAYFEDNVPAVDPGITITETATSGFYLVGGLPDYDEASDPDRLIVLVSPLTAKCRVEWPGIPPRLGAAAYVALGGRMDSGATLAVGDVGINFAATISGIPVDPTGYDVAFTLRCFNAAGVGNAKVIIDEAAAILNEDSVSEPSANGTYSAQFTYDTQAADLASPQSKCFGRFILDPDGSSRMTLTPEPELLIKIVE